MLVSFTKVDLLPDIPDISNFKDQMMAMIFNQVMKEFISIIDFFMLNNQKSINYFFKFIFKKYYQDLLYRVENDDFSTSKYRNFA